LKFAYTGDNVAITFGNYTDPGVLLAWRIDGQDWLFANVTPSATYQFVDSQSVGANLTNVGTTGQASLLKIVLDDNTNVAKDPDVRVQSHELVSESDRSDESLLTMMRVGLLVFRLIKCLFRRAARS